MVQWLGMPVQPYFFGPCRDAFFAGGFSLLALVAFFLLDSPDTAAWSLRASLLLLWFVNWPHFSATLQRLYHSKENILAHPFSALVSPLLFAGLGAIVLCSPLYASVPVHLYALWAPFHFSSQSLGISFIYARRSGIELSLWQRRAFVWFCHSSFLAMTAQVESSTTLQRFGVVSYPTLGVPTFLVPVALAVFGGCFIFWLWTLIQWKRKNERALPWIVLLPISTQVIWFTLGPFSSSFNQLVPMFHSLQYLPIVWWMSMKEEGVSLRASFQWARTNFLGGAVLFWGLPSAIALAGFPLDLAQIAVFTAINLHHFYIDGIIWKLRNPRVSSPLMGTLAHVAR